MNNFDFTAIDEMDPSLGTEIGIIDQSIGEGHRVVYEREVPFELRINDNESGPQEVGTLEAIRVKLLVQVRSRRSYKLIGG